MKSKIEWCRVFHNETAKEKTDTSVAQVGGLKKKNPATRFPGKNLRAAKLTVSLRPVGLRYKNFKKVNKNNVAFIKFRKGNCNCGIFLLGRWKMEKIKDVA
jgi:hypothetical protein